MPDERDKYDVLHGGWEAPASEVAQARARGVPAKGVAPGGGVLGFARVALLATLLSVSARNPRLRKGVLFSSRLSSFVNGVSSAGPSIPALIAFSEDFSGDLSNYTVDVKTGDVPVINGGKLEQPVTVSATQNAIWRKNFDPQGRTVITWQGTVSATQLSTQRSYVCCWFSEDPAGDVDNAYLVCIGVNTGAPRGLWRVTGGVLGSALTGSGTACTTSGWNGTAWDTCTLTVVVTIGASSVTIAMTVSNATFGGVNGTYTWVDTDVARYANIRSVGMGFWVTGATYAPSIDDVAVSAT